LPSVGVYSPREKGRRFKETASPFRRDGIAVPAQRHHRSGATASPFRRDGIGVSRHLNTRSGRAQRAKKGLSTGTSRVFSGYLTIS